MLLLTLNAVFAGIFFLAARSALMRALPFLRSGWTVIRLEVRKPDFRQNVESRRTISSASNFLIGGLFWMMIALGTAGLGLVFAFRAVDLQF